MNNLKSITLEMSLKPFKSTEQKYIEDVCTKAFTQWQSLLKHTDTVSVLLWASDGSEILDYKGDLEEPFEWAKYIGCANLRLGWDKTNDPNRIGLHTTNYLYTESPPAFTYEILKRIIDTLRRIGNQITGKPVRVGATFDPGPEFAKSQFKYKKHEEILMGEVLGKGNFVCCYGVLHEDKCAYAGYPEGIPEGTPFGSFFGRQCQHFLKDMGFDYLWLSNGFGFGSETWGVTGAIFDGKRFLKEKMDATQERILQFWKLFRTECPDYRIETRGTNLTVGIDLSTDAVNLQKIYGGNLNLLPPPNSPWAALDGDFGLELSGYMSRIAELPEGHDYLFRYYVHDPWWMNSPWIDRYEGQPHDIYMPLSVSRMDKDGKMEVANYLNFLTIDNSLGEMPEQCPNEIIPHILKAYEHQPDAASPFVWVYPFREYNEVASGRAEKPFFEDWYIRGAINNGLPLTTVISTDNFIELFQANPGLLCGSVVVTPVPEQGSRMNEKLTEFVRCGGKVMLYGSADGADEVLMNMLNIKRVSSIDGILNFQCNVGDQSTEFYSHKILHDKLLSDGGIDTILNNEDDKNTEVISRVHTGSQERIYSLIRTCPQWNGGAVIWIRGTNCSKFCRNSPLLVPFNPIEYYPTECLMRLTMQRLEYDIAFEKESPELKCPIIMIHRHENSFYFSGYEPNTTVKIKLKFPLGAPIFFANETKLEKGKSTYCMPRAWHVECIAFVEQKEDTVISCREYPSVGYNVCRRVQLSGLKNATVKICIRQGMKEKTEVLLNPKYPFAFGEKMDGSIINTSWGDVFEAKNVTGELLISERN